MFGLSGDFDATFDSLGNLTNVTTYPGIGGGSWAPSSPQSNWFGDAFSNIGTGLQSFLGGFLSQETGQVLAADLAYRMTGNENWRQVDNPANTPSNRLNTFAQRNSTALIIGGVALVGLLLALVVWRK